MKTKICSKCKKEKLIINFYKGNDNDELRYECKSCFKKSDKEYYKTHKEKVLMRGKTYRKLHKEQINKRIHNWQKIQYT